VEHTVDHQRYRHLSGGLPGGGAVAREAVIPVAYTSLTYTHVMAMTTIRVESELRDRLAAQAAAHGRSLGAELGAMLDEMMWQGIEAGYRRLAVSQAEMTAYQAEAAEWISADIPDLTATAADEYPEYNS
jgi:plasmid stability protein